MYSNLSPIDQEDIATLCIQLCNFFSPLAPKEIYGTAPQQNAKSIAPRSVAEFFNWSKNHFIDLWPRKQKIMELILQLEQQGILIPAGPRAVETILHNFQIATILCMS
jgi:hypothetical protein